MKLLEKIYEQSTYSARTKFVKVVVKGSRVLKKAHDETKMIRLGCILGVPNGDKFS